MATQEDTQKLQESLSSLLGYKDSDLINRDVWGDIDFRPAEPYIKSALQIADDLKDLPLEQLPSSIAAKVLSEISTIADLLRQIDSFSLSLIGTSPASERNRICDQLRIEFEKLFSEIVPFISYFAFRRGDLEEQIAAIRNAINEVKKTLHETRFWAGGQQNSLKEAVEKTLSETNETIEKTLGETNETIEKTLSETNAWVEKQQNTVEDIIQKIRATSARIGAGKFAPAFRQEAEDLIERSNNWLWVTAILGSATIAIAILFYFWPGSSFGDTGLQITLQSLVSKSAVIAVLFTGTVWCGRIYRALAHQATVNRHRDLSLQTFQTFVEGTEDPQVRDAVLLAATNTVFSNVPTGFVEPGGEQDNKINLVELTKSFRSNLNQGKGN